MQMHLVLDEDGGADEAHKAVMMIAYFVGQDAFAAIVNRFKGSAAPHVPEPDAKVIFGGGGQDTSAKATVLPAVDTGERDSEGLPWDARIHSSSKAKVAAGTWKFAKNLDDNFKMSVLAELRGGHAKPAADPMALPDALKRTAPPPPAASAAPPPPATDGAVTFIDLMKKITGGIHSGKLTQASIIDACGVAGLSNAAALSQPANAVHIPTVNAYIDALLMS